jgi:hypothetical protein
VRRKSQDRIAHEAGEGAFVAVDGLDQHVKGAVHDLHHVLGVQSLGHGRGAFDVAKQHGNGAPFSSHLAAGGQQSLGKLDGHQPLDCPVEPRESGLLDVGHR